MNICVLKLVKYKVFIVGEEVIVGDPATCGGSYHGGSVGSLKVGFYNLIVAPITETKYNYVNNLYLHI